jgi:aminoglycoside phosphotransferase (APT) family kinase protein
MIWERRANKIDISLLEISALTNKAINKSNITNIKIINSGLSNTNYVIEFEDSLKLILRIYQRDSNACLKEYNLSNLLQNNDLVPKVLYCDNSKSLLPYTYNLVEYRNGITLSNYMHQYNRLNDLKVIYEELGKFIKEIRNYKFNQIGPLDQQLEIETLHYKDKSNNLYADFILDCLLKENVKKKLGEENCKIVVNTIHENISLFPNTLNEKHLVHGDFKPDNILVDLQDNNLILSAIIDWEFAFSGSSLFDMATLFRNENEITSNLKKEFMRGYLGKDSVIDLNWNKQIKLLDLLNLCDLLDSSNDRKQLTNDVKSVILSNVEQINKI